MPPFLGDDLMFKPIDWLFGQILSLPVLGQPSVPVDPFPISARNAARLARKARRR